MEIINGHEKISIKYLGLLRRCRHDETVARWTVINGANLVGTHGLILGTKGLECTVHAVKVPHSKVVVRATAQQARARGVERDGAQTGALA